MRRENNEPIGPERRSSDPNGTKLASYKDIPAEEIPGYDDGAGGFDYENYDRANAAPGAQYTDEAAEAAFKKMKYTTDAAIRSGAGVDLGTIKNKSALNMLGIQSPLNKISGPCKAAAKQKFKVWPSAYASGWGVRCTKAAGPSNYG